MTVAQLVRVLAPSCRGATRNGEHSSGVSRTHLLLPLLPLLLLTCFCQLHAGVWRGKYRQQTVSVHGRAGGHKAAVWGGDMAGVMRGDARLSNATVTLSHHVPQKRSSRCACPATSHRSPPERTAHLNFLVPTLLAPSFASPCPLPYATTLLSPSLPSFPSLSSFHSLFSSPLPTTLTHLSHQPSSGPCVPPCPSPRCFPTPHSTVPADLREPAAAPPASNPLLPSLAVKLFCTCWQCGGSFGAAGRRGRPAATAPPCRASHATLAGNVVSLVREACECCSSASHVSAAPAHVSAAPAHVSAAPAHASAAPAHVGAFRVLSARLPGACQQRVQVLAMPRGWDAPSTSQASLSSPQYIAPSVVLPRLPSLSLS
ncbi:unnamed protein product [Closterium sp. NIES-65]|nr:unnamed protein product [Closterium sp. NIES-65]